VLQRSEVVLRDGVFQHPGVHGWADQFGAPGRKHHGGEHIIGNAVGHFGNDVGRGRCHQNDIRLFGQRDVSDLELEIAVKGVHHAFVTGQRLKDERGDEMVAFSVIMTSTSAPSFLSALATFAIL